MHGPTTVEQDWRCTRPTHSGRSDSDEVLEAMVASLREASTRPVAQALIALTVGGGNPSVLAADEDE